MLRRISFIHLDRVITILSTLILGLVMFAALPVAAVTVPTAPSLVSPGSSSTPGTTVSSLTPTMYWSSVSGATNYGLYVSDQTTGGNLVYNNDYVGNVTSLLIGVEN